MTYELIIIGGGVWGTSAALRATQRGVSSVLLVEANHGVAQESSAKAGGIVTDLVWNAEDVDWVQRSRTLFAQARTFSRDPSILQRYGMLTLATPERTELLQRRANALVDREIPAALWDYRQIVSAYPDLDRVPRDVIGLWMPNDCHVNPTAYSEAVLHQARDRGLQVLLGARVTALREEVDGVTVFAGTEGLHARRVLITAGTWTRKLVQTCGVDIPLAPYRVQLSSLSFPDGYHLPIVWELRTDVYLVPDGPHNLLAGDGTRLIEHDPDDYETQGDDEFVSSIADRVVNLSSRGDRAGLRAAWAGLCGSTPDRRPLIGPVTDRICIATGDQGFGIMRGPALGELAVDVVMGEEEVTQLNPLRYPPTDFPIRPGFTLEE